MNEKVKKFIDAYGKAVVVVLLLLLLSIVLVKCTDNSSTEQTTTEDEGVETSTVLDTESASTELETISNELRRDAYPEINALLEAYFDAKITYDVDKMSQLVYPLSGLTTEQLELEVEGIESYDSIEVYTKPGLLKDTYVAWVYYEIKFSNTQIAAPSLSKMYICTDEQGEVYIYNGTIEGEITSYIDGLSSDPEVLNLVDTVNRKFEEALSADEQLSALINQLHKLNMGGEEAIEEETIEEEASE